MSFTGTEPTRSGSSVWYFARDREEDTAAFGAAGISTQPPLKRPKLDPFTVIIDSILEEDRTVHRKQRHTAKRVFDRLCDEHGFTGGYTIVKDYIRERRHGQREMFVPLAHPPGHAQADFGEADAIIAGVKQRAHFFALELPHSDACCVVAYPAAAAEVARTVLQREPGHAEAQALLTEIDQDLGEDEAAQG